MTSATERVAPTPPPWREVFAGARGRLTVGLLLLEALVAIEALIVATILPAVEQDLGGLFLYGWTFTAFTLASLGTVPIAGRMTDRLGPRKVLAATVVLYVGGLLIAALAPSMQVVVLGRFVQGIGGGGLYVVSLAVVAKTYPERIRPRVMALLASMWILPGLIGPLLGGLIAQTVGWRWAFLGPIPAIALGVLLVLPSMGTVVGEPDEERLPVLASLQLMLGAGLFLAGLTGIGWATVVLVPVGLGLGLPALGRVTPRPRLIGVQPEGNAFMYHLYQHGTSDGFEDNASLADGLTGAGELDSVTIPIVRQLVDDIVLVSEAEIARAVAFAWGSYGEIIEGSGAVSLAAAIFGRVEARPAVAVVTGGNIDPQLHAEIAAHYSPEQRG